MSTIFSGNFKVKSISNKYNNTFSFISRLALFILSIILISGISYAFQDDFNDGLDKWTLYGSPSPHVLGSAEGRTGIYDNNGDSWCDSGIVSKEAFSYPNGFVLESDIFMRIMNPGQVFADAMFGLLRVEPAIQCNVQHGLVYRFSWDWGIHAQINGGFYAEDGTWEDFQLDVIDEDYIGDWHKFKVIVDKNRYVKFYVDDSLIYASVRKIDSTMLQGKKLVVHGRSLGTAAGKVYHDYVKLSENSVIPIRDVEKFEVKAQYSSPFPAAGKFKLSWTTPTGYTDFEKVIIRYNNNTCPEKPDQGNNVEIGNLDMREGTVEFIHEIKGFPKNEETSKICYTIFVQSKQGDYSLGRSDELKRLNFVFVPFKWDNTQADTPNERANRIFNYIAGTLSRQTDIENDFILTYDVVHNHVNPLPLLPLCTPIYVIELLALIEARAVISGYEGIRYIGFSNDWIGACDGVSDIGSSSTVSSDWPPTVIHELGHSLFGLCDEYSQEALDRTENPAGIHRYDCPNDCPCGRQASCEGNIFRNSETNRNEFCIMGIGTNGFCSQCTNQINQELTRLRNDPPVYHIKLAFFRTGDIILNRVYRSSNGLLEDLPGDMYNLSVFTKENKLLYSTNFTPSYALLTDPPQLLDKTYLDVDIPVFDNIDHIFIFKDGIKSVDFRFETNCSDNIDEDMDGKTDCWDHDCSLYCNRVLMQDIIDDYVINPGENATIILIPYVLDEDQTISDLVVQARIIKPDLSVSTISLLDDGTQGDHMAGDGFYSRIFCDTIQEGIYNVEFSASGILDGEEIHDYKNSIFAVRSSSMILSDLSIWKIAQANGVTVQQVDPGQVFSYNITITNKDLFGQAPLVIVTDKLPYEVEYLGAEVYPAAPQDYTINQSGDLIYVRFDQIHAGSTRYINITVKAPSQAPTTLYNMVNLRYRNDQNHSDNKMTIQTYVPQLGYNQTEATKSFEDLLHNQSQLLFQFEDLLHSIPSNNSTNYTFLVSFEQLLRFQATLTGSFEDLLSNQSNTGWDTEYSEENRTYLLDSYEQMLWDEAFLFASFNAKINDSWMSLCDYSVDGHTYDAQTELIASFEDLLKRQTRLYKSFNLLLKKIDISSHQDMIDFLAAYENLLRVEANLLVSFNQLLDMKYKNAVCP